MTSLPCTKPLIYEITYINGNPLPINLLKYDEPTRVLSVYSESLNHIGYYYIRFRATANNTLNLVTTFIDFELIIHPSFEMIENLGPPKFKS